MYQPSTDSHHEHLGFRRTFRQGHLSLGLFFPLEAFEGDTPSMLDQVTLAKRTEALGFSALWFRDVPLRDPSFGDVGQVFDPWVYLGYIAAHTKNIALGTASIALPLHHPLHTAKAAASVDQLSKGRLLLGVASGDRPVEFPAFNVDPEKRGERFREYCEVIRQVHGRHFAPLHWSEGELLGADVIPKPTTREIPLFVTGHSRQPLDWIARESHGWINYPRPPKIQRLIVEDWKEAVLQQCGSIYKPFVQSLYIDLDARSSTPPSPIHLGFRLGRTHLRALLQTLQDIGVDHVILNLKYGRRPAAEVIEELGLYVLPHFPGHGSQA
ncbi:MULTISPECIES: LLM class oxidoreductase [Pseudomonas]|jgi:luciferase-type oxidoreductase|uniref:LLM class oxidoreductase n=1 Tax=Pseudomonas TaxID=286 RepID=UPI000773429A|nr:MULTISPECIES: LLM class oxidoreductase [Pseudomonas]KXK69702.1 5,10-methylene tetrahydromethanopterin reductase [Pseudomonas monteilii]MBO2923026.1 LLM class oxidoreductase [Pseudomonas asiatica]MBS9761873.1 LLM class oxidoreductase [Pseudomonas mosselii]WPU59480.1 LLM class oxidoreductase [Pseudomonas asiatica]